MRVTENMLANQSLFNVQRALNQFMTLQDQMSTGKKVARPSDDPIGVQQALRFRSEIARIDQFQTNIELGTNLLNTYESTLADLNTLASQAFEMTVAVANETNDSQAPRAAYRDDIVSGIDRILQLISAELDGRQIFSGHRTDVDPLIIGSSGITYVGDLGQKLVEIDPSTNIQINLNAQEVLLKQFDPPGTSADLAVGIDSLSLLSEMRNGLGITLGGFNITDNNLGITTGIDLNVPAPAVTLGDVISRINTQLTAAGVTNLGASVGPSNNILFSATTTGQISNATPLKNLNGGVGVDLQPGEIRVHDQSGSIDFLISLTGSATVGDIIASINSGLVANGVNNVSVALNATSTGLDITDSNPTPLGLSFSDTSSTVQTAVQLGIDGLISPTLNGKPLLPQSDFTIAEGAGQTAADLGIIGNLSVNLAGTDLDAILTTTTPLSRLNNGNGFMLGSIQMTQGNMTRVVDLSDPAFTTLGDLLGAINASGLNITASINPGNTGIQIINNSVADSFLVENSGEPASATQLGVYGASDFMGAMYLFRNELQRPDIDSINRDDMQTIMSAIKSGMDELFIIRGNVGSKTRRLDATAAQLDNSELESIKLLSNVEDADITELVTKLASRENNYRAGLIAISKIVQPSLMDFLR
ncbi:MAG: flagellar hook-associated protein FlgL [Candidatus Zixiibacteriota bacterium]